MDIKKYKEMNPTNMLPSTWTWAKINEIAFVNPKNDYSDVKSDLPVTFVPMAAVDDISGSIMTPEIMSFEEARKGHTKFLENDVIFARITPCMENGKIAIARNLKNGFGFGSTEFHVMRVRDGILPDYVYHYVRQEKFRNFAAGFMTSTVGQLRVSKDVIGNAEIPLAPTNEQKRIVLKIEELFKESRAARETLDRVPQIMKRLRQSILSSAFRGELVSQDPNDEPVEKLLEKIKKERKTKWEDDLRTQGKDPKKFKYKESEPIETEGLQELPKGWRWTGLGEIADVMDVDHKMPKSTNKGIPFISPKDFKGENEIDFTKAKLISLEDFQRMSKKCKPQNGDILYSRIGTIGKVRLVPSKEFGISYSLSVVRSISNKINVMYLYYLLQSNIVFQQAMNKRRSIGVPDLGLNDMKKFAIPLAPTQEQNRIVAKISELFSFEKQIEKSFEEAKKRADRIDQSILAKAFQGELVPQDPNDEPAPVLLENIKSKK